ncbi:MAG: cyclase family protein [Candidatus Micrarchaeota archaeon]|nr:cyclase family protein [Candidatus Micrarchaeota archaeon]
MTRYLDLSMPLSSDTPVYPGDPAPRVRPHNTFEVDGWNTTHLDILSHFGTHMDAPFHRFADGKKLDDYPLSEFFGQAVVVDAFGQRPIDSDLSSVCRNDFVFFYTGQTEKAGTPAFFQDPPFVSEKTAQTLVEKGVRVVGLDSFSPDGPPYAVHDILLGASVRIVENLVNLKPLVGTRFECVILPLNLKDADGAPCRVVACLDDSKGG